MRLEHLRVGQRIQAADPSELFASCNDGKFGRVTSFTPERVWVEFDDGDCDYGILDDVTLIADVDNTSPTAISIKEKLEQIEALVAEIKTILG